MGAMKIRSNLPQFSGIQALLLVMGRQAGVFYSVRDGVIKEIDRMFVPTPKFSDKEGFFESRGHNIVRSGSVLQQQKPLMFRETLKEMEASLKLWNARNTPDEVYVFAPAHLMYDILERVKKIVGKAYAGSYCGSRIYAHPFDMLAEIAEEKAQRVVRPISEEALQLMVK